MPLTLPHPATMPDGPATPLPSASPGKEDARKEKLRKAGQEYFEKVLAQVTCPHRSPGSLRARSLALLVKKARTRWVGSSSSWTHLPVTSSDMPEELQPNSALRSMRGAWQPDAVCMLKGTVPSASAGQPRQGASH